MFGRVSFLLNFARKIKNLMIVKHEDTEKAVKYLFGELSESERDALEERIFSEEDFSLFLNATENDLVDEYVRGEMNSELHEKFEKKYLISENRREKIQVASILQKEVFAEKEVITPVIVKTKISLWESLTGFFKIPNLVWAGGLAAILLGILVIGLLMLRQDDEPIDYVKDDNSNTQTPLPMPQVSPTKESNIKPNENSNRIINVNKPENKKPDIKTTPSVTPIEKPDSVSPLSEPRIFVATLLPVLRSDNKPTLNIPQNSEFVQLKIVHDNQKPFVKYRLEIRNQQGSLILNQIIPVNEKTLARPINLSLQNSLLKAGSYEITLSGTDKNNSSETIKFYNFAVNQKR